MLAGFALLGRKKTDDEPELLENPYIDEEMMEPDFNPFPEMAHEGTPFDDNFEGWTEPSEGYVETPSVLEMLNPEQENFYVEDDDGPSIQVIQNSEPSMGSADPGNAPGFYDYGTLMPYSNPEQESREAISYNQSDYVPEEESTSTPTYYQTPIMPDPMLEQEQIPISQEQTRTPILQAPQLQLSPTRVSTQQSLLQRSIAATPLVGPVKTAPILTGVGILPVNLWGRA